VSLSEVREGKDVDNEHCIWLVLNSGCLSLNSVPLLWTALFPAFEVCTDSLRCEVPAVVKMLIVFWIVMLCGDTHSEDGGDLFLCSFSNHLQDHTVS
jgi:hypothetical protein